MPTQPECVPAEHRILSGDRTSASPRRPDAPLGQHNPSIQPYRRLLHVGRRGILPRQSADGSESSSPNSPAWPVSYRLRQVPTRNRRERRDEEGPAGRTVLVGTATSAGHRVDDVRIREYISAPSTWNVPRQPSRGWPNCAKSRPRDRFGQTELTSRYMRATLRGVRPFWRTRSGERVEETRPPVESLSQGLGSSYPQDAARCSRDRRILVSPA